MTYENFVVPSNYWEYVLGQRRASFINNYYKKNKNYPTEDVLKNVALTTEEKEQYKRIFYAQYKATGIVPNEPNTPQEPDVPSIPPVSGSNDNFEDSHIVNVKLNFSVMEDTINASQTMLLGESLNEEYTNHYWTIIIFEQRNNNYSPYRIGSFDSLQNITVGLNLSKRYTIIAFYRKTNNTYNYLFNKDSGDHVSINNTFSNFFLEATLYDYENASVISPNTGDKDYIGIVDGYTPTIGGTIKITLYTYNPRIVVNVSGFTSAMQCFLHTGVKVYFDTDGNLTTDGNLDDLIINSNDSFTYLFTKERIVLHLNDLYMRHISKSMDSINSIIGDVYGTVNIKCNDNWLNVDGASDSYNTMRNDITTINIVIPPQIDTDFEFEIKDDGIIND